MTPLSPEKAEASVREEFEKFRGKIEPTEREISLISASHIKMQTLLKNSTDVHVVDTFLTGSYARQTMIRPLKDVDFFVQVHYRSHKNDNPIQLLNKIRKVLKSAYPSTPIGIILPCVKVGFGYCHFEVVPAIGVAGDDEKFMIPSDKRVGWQETYPKIPDKWMTEENKKAGGLFKPTIKILKRWRDVHNVPLRSFHLEMLERLAFEYYNISNCAEGAWAFFKRANDLMEINKRTPFINEPGRTNVYVDQYLYDNPLKLRIVREKIALHHKRATKTFDYIRIGRAGAAKALWRSILGSAFYPQSNLTISSSPSFTTQSQTPLSSILSELMRQRNKL